MKKDEILQMTKVIIEASNLLQHSVHLAGKAMPDDRFKEYEVLVGTFLVDILCDVLNPAFRDYPDLKPEGWDDPYVPSLDKDLGK